MSTLDCLVDNAWKQILATYEVEGQRLDPRVRETKIIWEHHIRRWIKNNVDCFMRLQVSYDMQNPDF